MSKCTTEAEFIAVFQRFCAEDSLFVVTRTPKPVGAASRLSITLADGKPMLVGAGRVVDSFKGQDNEFKRPGMRLALTNLDGESRETMAKLNAARKQIGQAPLKAAPKSGNGATPAAKSPRATIMAPAVPPPLSRPPIKIPNIPRVGPMVRPEATPIPERIAATETEAVTEVKEHGEPPIPRLPAIPSAPKAPPSTGASAEGDDEVTQVSGETEKRAETGQPEERTEGSDFILPANPFGELTDANLEAFVECTLYEETGTISLAEAEGRPPEEEMPPWWPQGAGGDGSHTPLPPAAPGMLPPDTTREVHLHRTPLPTGPGGAPLAGDAPRMRAMTPPPMATGVDPNLLTPFPGSIRRRPSWVPLAVTAGITAALTLIIGYALWGSGASTTPAPTPSPAVPSATDTAPAKATDTAPVNATDTAPANATEAAADTAPEAAQTTDTAPEAAADTAPEAAQATADTDPEATADTDPEPAAATADSAPVVQPDSCVLTLSSNADAAMALVNGKRIGRVPLSKAVACDAKKLTLEHPRYETRSLALALHAGQESKVKAMMHRPIFQLKVLTRPSGATVTVDGHTVGNSPVSTKIRGYLYMTVKVSKPGYKTYVKRLYARNKSTTIRARLTR